VIFRRQRRDVTILLCQCFTALLFTHSLKSTILLFTLCDYYKTADYIYVKLITNIVINQCFRLGSTCNHVAALLFKVDYAWQNGLTRGCKKSCTSTTNKWIAPASVHIESVQARNMIVKKSHFRMKHRPNESTVSRQLFSTVRSSKDITPLTLDDISSAIFPDCPNSVAFRYSHAAGQAQFAPYDDVNVDKTIEASEDNLVSSINMLDYTKQFHSPSLFIPPRYSSDEIKAIELKTKMQNECPMWHTLRKGRISASNAHDVVTRTISLECGKCDDSRKLVSLITVGAQVNPNLPALKYGRENECRAVDEYYIQQRELHSSMRVECSGLFLHDTKSFLCASPDRLVYCDCCGEGLLEVKCPISIAGLHPQSANLPFLQDVDGCRSLKISHKYYTQVQMQMAITKRYWCDFVVYSTRGLYLERIHYDAVFWENVEDILTRSFYSYVVPEIVSSSAP
jgi:hypothetical protein